MDLRSPILISQPAKTHAAARRPGAAIARAFTLIELLVVMGIIVLIIAFALPAFRFMSGDRSVEAGQNMLASILGTARADAIGVQQPKGVAIYREAVSGRVAVALVEFKSISDWAVNTDYNPGDYVKFTDAKVYVTILPHTAVNGTNDPGTSTVYWHLIDTYTNLATTFNSSPQVVLDVVGNSDRLLLPNGIDIRGAGNTTTYSGVTSRCFTPTVILFDGYGALTTKPFQLFQNGALGSQIDISNPLVPALCAATGTYPAIYGNVGTPAVLTSQIGVLLFDDEQFKTASPAAGSAQDDWLDVNATPVMINRYNGTLVKGE